MQQLVLFGPVGGEERGNTVMPVPKRPSRSTISDRPEGDSSRGCLSMAPTRDSSSSQVPYGEKGDREGEVSAADCLGRSSGGARDDLPRRRIPPSLLGFAADFTASSRKLQFPVYLWSTCPPRE
jgi:hypothetical protein